MKKYDSFKKALGCLTIAAIAFMNTGCGSKENETENNSISDIPTTVTTATTETAETTTVAETIQSEQLASKNNSAYNSVFSQRDLNPDFENITAEITLNGDSAVSDGLGINIDGSVITITQEGIYKISGKLNDGQIIVNAPDSKVQLILDNADINCNTSSAIYGVDSKKIFISLAENSVNNLSDNGSYIYSDETKQEPDACIFSSDSLTINGTGTLNIKSGLTGIHSKDDVVITGGNINISSESDGIKGKDYVAASGGTFNITTGGDGIKSTNINDSSLGYVYIEDGQFTIDAVQDGIQAETDLTITGGTFDITSNGGMNNSTKTHTDDFSGMRGGGFNKNFDFSGMEMPDGFSPDENMTPPDGFGGMRDGGFNKDFDFSDMEMPDGFSPDNFGGAVPPDMQENQSETSTDETTTISTKGIKGGTSVNISGGEFTINSADDAIHSVNAYIDGGSFILSAGDDGIHADEKIQINGGTININDSYEGIEAAVINVSGGDIKVKSSDDGFNASDGVTSQNGMGTYTKGVEINISGGNVYVDAEGDGLDSNGDMTISGGTVIVEGPTNGGNGALDSNNSIIVTGGTLIAVGQHDMAEYPDNNSTQYTVSYTTDSNQQAGTIVKLVDENSAEIIEFTSTKSFDNIIISSPDILKDNTYTFYIDDTEAESFTASEIVTAIGQQSTMGGGFGGGGMHDGGGRGGNKFQFRDGNTDKNQSSGADL